MLAELDMQVMRRDAVEVEEGAIYTGQWSGSQRHGQGQQVWPDGMRFDGYWAYGEHNGFGRMIYPDGSYFKGEWKDN